MITLLTFLFLLFSGNDAQPTNPQLISGPMIGYVEHQEAIVCYEVNKETTKTGIRYWKKNKSTNKQYAEYKGVLGREFNPIKVTLTALEANSDYEYEILLENKPLATLPVYTLKTKPIFEFEPSPANFSFLVGSCAYINEQGYERPGEPYGQDPKIFETMGKTPSDFMLWGGDNVYLREPDYSSEYGIRRRYSINRSTKQFAKLLSSRPNYAIWDDHDFGTNDATSEYQLKEISLECFKTYWGNKTYGESDNPGIYSKMSYADADFFLMDDRYYRSANKMKDSIEGIPNAEKHFYGDKQLTWLKNNLLNSKATFKFIVSGSQMTNPIANKECFRYYSYEFAELMDFIATHKINGIIFISGDRHFSDVMKLKRENAYPLYEITCSGLSSEHHPVNEKERKNPMRIPGALVEGNNFGHIKISGIKNKRILTVLFYDINGKELFNFSINEEEIEYK